jgi:hypothetical protein
MSKKGFKRVLGLKKWNKIVSALVKDYKKSNTPYEFKDVRKEASEIYKSFKKIPLRKLSQKKIKQVKVTLGKVQKPLISNTIKILATDIPKSEIDKVGGWRFFEIDNVSDFNSKFPEVPILIKTPNNEFKINGSMGGYGSSDLANFVNTELREEYGSKEKYDTLFESSVAIQERNKLPYLLLTTDDLTDIDLNKLIKTKVEFPEKVDRIVREEVKKRIETEEEKQARLKAEKKAEKKRKKGELTKKKVKTEKPTTKKKVSTTKKTTPKKTTNDKVRLAELRIEEQKNIMEMFKLGLLNKKEANQMIKELKDKYNTGGKI